MDVSVLRARYAEQVRRHPEDDGPDARAERDGQAVVRGVDPGVRAGVTWSELDDDSVVGAIERRLARFAEVHTDASADSRPIFVRRGLPALGAATPYVFRPRSRAELPSAE